jgi:hypothetical protein
MMNGNQAPSDSKKSPFDPSQYEKKDSPPLIFAQIDCFDNIIENLSSTLNQTNTLIDKLKIKITIAKQKASQNSFMLEGIHDISIDLIHQLPQKISRKNKAIDVGTNLCLSLGIFSTLLEVFKLDPSITSILSLLQLSLVLIVSYGIVFAVKDSIVKQIATTENIAPYRKYKPNTKDLSPPTPQVERNLRLGTDIKPELQTQSLSWVFNNYWAMLNCGFLMFLDFCFSVPGVWLSLPSNVHPLVRGSSIIAVLLFSYLNISNALVMASNKILRDLKRQQKINIITGESGSQIILLVERAYKLDLTIAILEDKYEKLLDRAVELEDKIADLEEERLDIIRNLDSDYDDRDDDDEDGDDDN